MKRIIRLLSISGQRMNQTFKYFADEVFDPLGYINTTVLNKSRRRWWMDNLTGLGNATMERVALELSKIPIPKTGGFIHNVTLPNPIDLLNEDEADLLVERNLEEIEAETEVRMEAQKVINKLEQLKKIKEQEF